MKHYKRNFKLTIYKIKKDILSSKDNFKNKTLHATTVIKLNGFIFGHAHQRVFSMKPVQVDTISRTSLKIKYI